MRLATAMMIFALVLSAGCSDDATGIDYHLSSMYRSTEQIRYVVEGGGEIEFTILRSTAAYQVDVGRYNYAPASESFYVSEAELEADDATLLAELFLGTVDIGGTLYTPEGETGTWTYVYILDGGTWLRIGNADVIAGLRSVYMLVRDRLP